MSKFVCFWVLMGCFAAAAVGQESFRRADAPAVQPPSFTINVRPGQKFSLETETVGNSVAETPEVKMEQSADIHNTTLFEVVSVSASEITWRLTNTRMRLTTTVAMSGMPTRELSFDSSDSAVGGETDEMFRREWIKQKPLGFTTDLRGRVLRQDKEPELVFGQLTPASGTHLGFDLFTPELSEMELRVGNSVPAASSVDTKRTGTFTIKAIRDGIASVSYSGISRIDTKSSDSLEGDMTVETTDHADFEVSTSTGVLVSGRWVIDIKKPFVYNGLTITTTGKMTISKKVTPLN